MRILLLTTSFPVKDTSSSGIFVKRLAMQLGVKSELRVLAPASVDEEDIEERNLPYELSVFTYGPRRFQVLAHSYGGIPVILKAKPWTGVLLPTFLFSMFISCWYHARKCDVIYANWSICGVVAGVVGVLCRCPVVTTIRGADANRAKSSYLYRFFIKLCLRLNRNVVAVSEDIASALAAMESRTASKVVMIPNGVERSSRLKRKIPPAHEVVKLFIVGSLIKRKSVHTAISALALLPEKFYLTILGDGPERNYLETLVEQKKLSDRVNFKGHIHPQKISMFLHQADMLVVPSLSEGRPNSVLEAMAAGLPVVGSDIPGIRELVRPGMNGELFPVNEHAKLAEMVLKMEKWEVRVRLGDKGYDMIEDFGLTWERTAERYLELFEKSFPSREG